MDLPATNVRIEREDTATGGRYVARIEGGPEAEMTFSKAGATILIIDHTGVPDVYAGKGVGKALVEYMVMDVRAKGLKIIPLCPFTAATLRKHPEWQDVLKDPF